MPFVSTTGFLNSDGSTFTAHIATNVSSSPIPCHVAASLCHCVSLSFSPHAGAGFLPEHYSAGTLTCKARTAGSDGPMSAQ